MQGPCEFVVDSAVSYCDHEQPETETLKFGNVELLRYGKGNAQK